MLLVVLVGVFLPMTLRRPATLGRALFVHHAEQFDELLVLEGKRPTVPTGEGMRGHFLPKVPKPGAPFRGFRDKV